jgi:hypothetical protein
MGAAEDVATEMKSEGQQPADLKPSVVLGEKISAVRGRQVSVTAGTGAAIVVGAFVILLGVAMALDWWLDSPLTARALTLLAIAGLAGYAAWRFVLLPILRQPDDDLVALQIERARPQFRSRLISSVQFARRGALPDGTAVSLARMTIAETEQMARTTDFTDIVPTRDLQKVTLWTVAVLALAIFAFLYGGDVTRDLLKRAFLSSTPVPRHTRVFVLAGEERIGRGDPIRIEAAARGVVPKTGRLVLRTKGRRPQEFVMERGPSGNFARTIENVQDSFDFTVRLNDGVSKAHHVQVVPRPSAASVECEQVFPAYTGLPAMKRSLGDLSLLAGSQLKVKATATRDLVQAVVRLAGLSNDVPARLNPQNPRELVAEFAIPPKGLTGFSIDMLDTAGMQSRDPAIYRIDVVPDRPPKVRVSYPDRREELVTRQAVQPIGFEAGDDFRISSVRLRYRVGESEEAEIRTIELDPGTNAVKQMKNVYPWSIRDFQPPLLEGTRIEFWIEVTDNNDVTGPGVGATEHQLLRVVSENEKRADLLNRAGDFLGTINDVTGDQEKLNFTLGTFIYERGPGRSP